MNRHSKKLLVAVLFAVFLFNFPSTSHADEMWHKFGRGVSNIFLSTLEIPYQWTQLRKGENEILALIGAFPKGALVGVKRFGIGLYEVFTFPEPPYDKVYIEPEFLIPNE